MSFLLHNMRQRERNTCALCCVGILIGQYPERLTRTYQQDYISGKLNLADIMNQLEIAYEPWPGLRQCDLATCEDGAYLCSVPSLEKQGEMHYVIIEKSEQQYQVLDPMSGTGKPYYSVHTDDTAGCVPLTSWVVDAYFSASRLKARRLQ